MPSAALMSAIVVLVALLSRTPATLAQCPGRWLPGDAMAGTNGPVFTSALMPDGDLVVGGEFSFAGGVSASNIARWNGSAWVGLGTGLSPGVTGSIPEVTALLPLPGGELIVGGYFNIAGGTYMNNIARWTGTSWVAMGTGTGGTVDTLARMPNGDILAAGTFSSLSTNYTNSVMRWDGTAWSAVGSGGFSGGGSGSVAALAVMPNGDIVAAGNFASVGGTPANGIARWNGTSWAAMDAGLSLGGGVYALAALSNGDLVAAGFFDGAVARWNGSIWQTLGTGLGGSSPRTLALEGVMDFDCPGANCG